jgi:copper chaperone CopZ
MVNIMAEVRLKLEGLNCGNCIRSVREALNSLDYVSNATVGLREVKVTVDRNNDEMVQDLISAIEFVGYNARAL